MHTVLKFQSYSAFQANRHSEISMFSYNCQFVLNQPFHLSHPMSCPYLQLPQNQSSLCLTNVEGTCFCCRSNWRQGPYRSSRSKRVTGGPWQTRTTRTSGARYDKYSYNAWLGKQLRWVATEWNLAHNCSKLVTIKTWWESPLIWGSPSQICLYLCCVFHCVPCRVWKT